MILTLSWLKNHLNTKASINEILEDITEYEAHKIYQQMIRLSGGF